MNRREREEFARIERELTSDPEFGASTLLARPPLVPLRLARAAVLAGIPIGAAPLAIETGFSALALVSFALFVPAAASWVRLVRVAYGADQEGPPRLSPLVVSGALFLGSAMATLLAVVMLAP